ncbi:hypothetical protein AMS68_003216 [Peltaster fructicola]|uniref:Ketoreductase (KR) domain-containing protein n=1 Tax=Peltaster fructicola TaxID=286661 RepID=A0A6H0XSV4_9PEZI|nr:hypothetical protein AMS68_003216 [Peltaster fructicola]
MSLLVQMISGKINPPKDIDVLNAGISATSFEKSQYGWERTLHVNLLSTVLLVLMLLPKRQQSKSTAFTPVLEIVNSARHILARPHSAFFDEQIDPLESYNTSQDFGGFDQYSISKLYLMYAMQELAAKLPVKDGKHDVHIVAVCPGAAVSDLAREMSGPVLDIVKWAIGIALGKQAIDVSGRTTSRTALLIGPGGAKLQARVWDSIISTLSKHVPEVKNLVVQSLSQANL